MCNIRIMKFVLMEMGMILSDSFNLASSPDGLSALILLTALFSLFECSAAILGHVRFPLTCLFIFGNASAFSWSPPYLYH